MYVQEIYYLKYGSEESQSLLEFKLKSLLYYLGQWTSCSRNPELR